MSQKPLFDLDAVFEVDDYMYFYSDSLTDERSDAEVASLVKLIELDSSMKILDLACGFGRHANRLAALGHSVAGVDFVLGFLEIARKNAAEMGVRVNCSPDWAPSPRLHLIMFCSASHGELHPS